MQSAHSAKHLIAAGAIAAWSLSISAAAQDSLSAAKDLYASAAYEEALTALDRMKASSPSSLTLQVDQYRAFCLLALGRTSEAEAVAEEVLRVDPLVEIDSADASPRIVAMFSELQRKVLPGAIRERYRAARAAMEQGDGDRSAQQFTLVQQLLDKSRALGVWDDALADMKVLVDGFMALNHARQEQMASQSVQAAAAVPPAGVTGAPGADSPAVHSVPAAESTVGSTPPPTPVATASVRPEVFSALDERVSAPIVLKQETPRVPYNLFLAMRSGKRDGIVEVTIDERGQVENAVMRDPVNDFFDTLVLAAARQWQYLPAKRDGIPVRYMKRIAVTLRN
jgi:TonB family protein